jgi:O-antigen/teichoic acid export membrane protein
MRSPSLRVAGLFALVGAGFAGGSLLLARALSREEFGTVALWLAIYYVSGALAPWGAEGVVNRHRILPGGRLARRALFTSAVTATLSAGAAMAVYQFTTVLGLLLWIAIVAGGLGTVAAAQFQARHRFLTSMSIWRGSNIVLLGAAVAALAEPRAGVLLPIGVFTGGQVLVAIAGWLGLRRVAADEPEAVGEPFAWREALAYFAAASATAVLPQIERLVIPGLLSLDDLAAFGVLAALVIAPYRMFQAGVNYTLFPRLGKAASKRHRRLLIAGEVRTMLMGGIVVGLLIWYVAPTVAGAILGDKYELGTALLLAGLVAGCAKLVEALGRATVSALGTNRDLALYGTASWVALGAACVGAWLGSPWGVPGVIYGTLLGLSIRSISGLVLGMRHLDDPVRSRPRRASAPYPAEEGATS